MSCFFFLSLWLKKSNAGRETAAVSGKQSELKQRELTQPQAKGPKEASSRIRVWSSTSPNMKSISSTVSESKNLLQDNRYETLITSPHPRSPLPPPHNYCISEHPLQTTEMDCAVEESTIYQFFIRK